MEVNQFSRHGAIPEYSVRATNRRPASEHHDDCQARREIDGQLMAINVSGGMQVSLCGSRRWGKRMCRRDRDLIAHAAPWNLAEQ